MTTAPAISIHDPTAGDQLAAWLASFPADSPALIVLAPVAGAAPKLPRAVEPLLRSAPVLLLAAAPVPAILDSGAAVAVHNAASAHGGAGNVLAAACGRRDLVLLAPDIELPDGWLERLRSVATASSAVALAAPLCAGGGFDVAPGMPVLRVAAARAAALGSARHPALLWAPSGCVYIRRLALDALGGFDEALPLTGGADLDLWLRAAAAALSGALVDDLLAVRPPAGGEPAPLHPATLGELVNRHPWLANRLAAEPALPVAEALAGARALVDGPRIAVDVTALRDITTGTQVLAIELLRALRASAPPQTRLAAIVADDAVPAVRALAARYTDTVVTPAELGRSANPRFDLVHRPYQIYASAELELLLSCARRLVVSNLDCIGYWCPTIADTPEQSLAYRQLARRTYAVADGVAYISADAAREAERHGLALPADRSCVTWMGVDHRLAEDVAPKPPPLREALGGAPFLLMVGNGFTHKNRSFALRLLQSLDSLYGWQGHLVLAGSPVPIPVPAVFQKRVHQPGVVREDHKRWLLAHAALVLMPSLAEGFGLVPFEAAALGTPALASRQASLAEVLGDEVRAITTFDPAEAAAIAWELVSDPAAARQQVTLIRERAAGFSWDRVAADTWAFYLRVLALPPRPRDGQAVAAEALLLQERLAAELVDYRQLMASRTLGPLIRGIILTHIRIRRLKDRILGSRYRSEHP